MESAIVTDLATIDAKPTDDKPKPPRDIAPKQKAYAFERSLGIPPCEACRRAGGNDRNGAATKWERSRGVQAWIKWYRSGDCTEDMLAAKRQRLEDRLNLAAYVDMFDFTTIVDRVMFVKVGEEEMRITVQTPVIDWNAVAASPYRVAIEKFKFDKDSGYLTEFERDSADRAIAQLRDMHGFKSVNKTALTDPTGEKPASVYLISEKPMTEAEWEAQHAAAD